MRISNERVLVIENFEKREWMLGLYEGELLRGPRKYGGPTIEIANAAPALCSTGGTFWIRSRVSAAFPTERLGSAIPTATFEIASNNSLGARREEFRRIRRKRP